MIVQRIITALEDMELDVEGITLLTREEVKALPTEIRKCDDFWWLRSQGFLADFAAFVDGRFGNIDACGRYVSDALGVRPALRVNLKSINLQIGDKVAVFGYVWTVITENLILCDNIVGESLFREDYANDYETSDIKKWVEKWYADQVALAESEE